MSMTPDTTVYIESIRENMILGNGEEAMRIIDDLLHKLKEPQPVSVSVESLCKQLKDANPYPHSGIDWNRCVEKLYDLLTDKIITTEQAISDVWDHAFRHYLAMGLVMSPEKYPEKKVYLKEHFGIEPQ